VNVERRFGPRDALFGAGVFVAALVLRAVVVETLGAEPTWDGQFYHRGAESIAAGFGYSEPGVIDGKPVRLPWSHYPVGYSAALGALYAWFGASARVALWFNSLIGALTALVTFAFALHPGLVLYCALVMTEPLAGFLVLLTGYTARRLGRHPISIVLCAALLAASCYVRPQSLLAAPLLALLFPGTWKERLAQVAATALLSLALVAPWSVRNCRALDACAFVSTNGGWNLAISALSDTGRFRPLTPQDGCAGVNGSVAQDRCWAQVGWTQILRDPGRWLARIPDKLRHTYNHESFAVAYLAEAEPSEWERDHTWRVMNVMTAFHHALMLVAALGLVARFSFQRWREAWGQIAILAALALFVAYALSLPERPLFWIGALIPLLALLRLPGAPRLGSGLAYLLGLLAVTTLTHMIFFGDDRYHLTISPVLCVLAAAAFRRAALSHRAEPQPTALATGNSQAIAE
jgi:hypothetical protein